MFDVLELLPDESFIFRQSGLVIDGENKDNLCVRAYNLMKYRFGIEGLYVHLIKNIPMGAGLGGGSADAAYMILGINQVFNLRLSENEMQEIAAELGSDCSFFIRGGIQFAEGRGEKLISVQDPLKGFFIKVINPGIHIGTAQAYAAVIPNDSRNGPDESIQNPVGEWKFYLENDFEYSLFRSHSELSEIKQQLYAEGATYASMSGSGSTMFGLYHDRPEISTNYSFERIYQL